MKTQDTLPSPLNPSVVSCSPDTPNKKNQNSGGKIVEGATPEKSSHSNHTPVAAGSGEKANDDNILGSKESTPGKTSTRAVQSVTGKVRHRKRATNYHSIPEPIVKKKYSLEKSKSSEVKKSGDYPGTKHSRDSSTDDYKRRTFEEQEKKKELLANTGYSAKCYLISIGIAFFVLLLCMGATYFVFKLPFPSDVNVTTPVYGSEKSYRTIALMSDNLDCSIYMKRLTRGNKVKRMALAHGMMCLMATEPHSAAPDSSVSMMFYYRQNRQWTAESSILDLLDPKKCVPDNVNNTDCVIRSHENFRSAFVSLNGNIRDTNFFSQLLVEDFPDYYTKNHDLFYKVFNRNEYNQVVSLGQQPDPVNEERFFRVSSLFKKMLSTSSSTATKVDEWRTLVSTGGPIVADEKLTSYVLNGMFDSQKKREPYVSATLELKLDSKLGHRESNSLMIPRGPTMSIIAAFVIKTVYALHLESPLSEPKFYAHVLEAQKLAYQLLPSTNEWVGKFEKSGLLSDSTIANAIEHLKNHNVFGNDIQKRIVTRTPDRVVSVVMWRYWGFNAVGVINMGLPSLFDSSEFGAGPRANFSSFKSDGKTSVSFTSACSILVVKSTTEHAGQNTKERYGKPIMVVTGSGSVRTVESVAIATLRMLIFDEGPGKAAQEPGAYYDVRDGKFYCEKDRGTRTNENGDKTNLFDEMRHESRVSCESPPSNDVMAIDRLTMVGRKETAEAAEMQTAVDDRSLDYNYPVGF